jgi:uncharacterized protein
LSKSLQEQLLSAGLVSTKQVQQANASKSKNRRQKRRQNTEATDNTRLELEQKQAAKAERDRVLNRKREEERQRHDLAVQIKQLVDENQIAEDNEGEPFHFDHLGIVKKVYVSDPVRHQIINGQLGIVISARRYHVVPSEIALKIKSRDESALVLLQERGPSKPTGNIDPAYAEYEVPDDLIW